MPTLTGTNAALAASMKTMIEAKLTAATGEPMLAPTFLQAFCEGVADALIPHLVANTQVNPGQVVTGVTGPTAAPGTPTPIPGSAATSTPGTIS
jgi:hypothetical protein